MSRSTGIIGAGMTWRFKQQNPESTCYGTASHSFLALVRNVEIEAPNHRLRIFDKSRCALASIVVSFDLLQSSLISKYSHACHKKCLYSLQFKLSQVVSCHPKKVLQASKYKDSHFFALLIRSFNQNNGMVQGSRPQPEHILIWFFPTWGDTNHNRPRMTMLTILTMLTMLTFTCCNAKPPPGNVSGSR